MSFSDAAKDIIKKQLDVNKGGTSTMNKVTYTVVSGLLNGSAQDGTVASVSYKFNKPVSQDLLNTQLPGILKNLVASLDVQEDGLATLDAMFTSILGKGYGKRVGRKRTSGNVAVNFGDAADAEGEAGAAQSVSGRFVSNSNMKSILEILAKSYLIKDMQKAGAPLKFRTGRFANSLKIKDVLLKDAEGKKPPELNVTYNYMLRPYSVFNPAVSTYRGLSLRPFRGARNPQKLIGEAIAKAIRDIIHSRYRAVVKQGT
ncbi:putative tail completion protein [Erwinia phage KEY]|uniref:Tail completion protein n=2 Tax=Keyvirus TaxID=3152642 RepID=A0AAE7WCD9_9CAUD|nr:putative tail completion protein [Pantoea phage vB_PagS_AAS21]QYC51500.1 putative tail completion protein [Erwinia phage KEY]